MHNHFLVGTQYFLFVRVVFTLVENAVKRIELFLKETKVWQFAKFLDFENSM